MSEMRLKKHLFSCTLDLFQIYDQNEFLNQFELLLYIFFYFKRHIPARALSSADVAVATVTANGKKRLQPLPNQST